MIDKANIIDIKHFSVHDGPGIRTTVFLKGCPLRCNWCHNPESQLPITQLGFKVNSCIQCQICAQVCPCHTFVDNQHYIDRNKCTSCGKCVNNCPVNALELYGKKVTIKEVIDEILQDKILYQNSSGGCTVSGGEPLLQSKFCKELFCQLKQHNIHTAVDTCGAVSWNNFEDIIPFCDMFLFDLKHPDSQRHKEGTSLENNTILTNLVKLDKYDKPIEVRIPLIPNFNSDDDSLTGFVKILSNLKNLTGVKILPYHKSRFKYQAIGQEEILKDLPPCSIELFNDVKLYFNNNNITILED
jgi:pyruvate formate lyase activating enzyme